jgi:hypothetical protein
MRLTQSREKNAPHLFWFENIVVPEEKNGLASFAARLQGSGTGCLHSKKRHVDQK